MGAAVQAQDNGANNKATHHAIPWSAAAQAQHAAALAKQRAQRSRRRCSEQQGNVPSVLVERSSTGQAHFSG